MAKKITIPYKAREWQIKAHKARTRFSVLVVHRRAGKTVFALNELLRDILTCTNKNPRGAYIAPTYSQAKKVAWDYLKEYTAPIPGVKVNESELRVDLPNGGRIMLLGAENPDALRGIYLDTAVLDEVADMPSTLWGSVVRPLLADRKGSAIFIGTPKGRNMFHDLYVLGRGGTDEDWSSNLLTYQDTGELDDVEIESVKREIAEEEFEQEFMCSFDAAIKGAYFGKAIARAEDEGRITFVPHDSGTPVVTSWDIGLDGTVIWYAQANGDGLSIIDCSLFTDEDIPEVMRVINSKPYNYSEHIVPHDAAKRSILDKSKSTLGLIKSLSGGVKVRKLKKAANNELTSEIHATRKFINKCVFDRVKCQKGLDMLRLYRAKLDQSTGAPIGSPVKSDGSSHVGDSFRTMAMGYRKQDRHPPGRYMVQGSYNPLSRNHDQVNSHWNPYGRIN